MEWKEIILYSLAYIIGTINGFSKKPLLGIIGFIGTLIIIKIFFEDNFIKKVV